MYPSKQERLPTQRKKVCVSGTTFACIQSFVSGIALARTFIINTTSDTNLDLLADDIFQEFGGGAGWVGGGGGGGGGVVVGHSWQELRGSCGICGLDHRSLINEDLCSTLIHVRQRAGADVPLASRATNRPKIRGVMFKSRWQRGPSSHDH